MAPASSDSEFARTLRELRTAAGLSQADLGRRVHYTKSYISKIETGLKSPAPDLARRCDAALRAEGRLAALVATPVLSNVPPAAPAAEIWTIQMSADGRSEFLGAAPKGMDPSVTASAFVFKTYPATAPRHTPGLTIPAFQALFGSMRQLGQTMPPAALLPVLIAQTNALRAMVPQGSPTERDQILLLTARYAEFAGWMAQEAGSDEAAMWWTDQSSEMAEAAGSADFAAYALVRQALVTMYRHDAMNTIMLAQLAQEQTRNSRIAGLAAQREAQGHALANDERACLAALDRARELLDGDALTNEPMIGTTTIDDPVTIATGWCLHELGRPQEASEILAREIPRIPEHAHRAFARYSARYALSCAAAGEAEMACEVAEGVLTILERTESATIRTDLVRLARELNRANRSPVVREFSPRLTRALRTAPPGREERIR